MACCPSSVVVSNIALWPRGTEAVRGKSGLRCCDIVDLVSDQINLSCEEFTKIICQIM
jgi:hypothetical protein